MKLQQKCARSKKKNGKHANDLMVHFMQQCLRVFRAEIFYLYFATRFQVFYWFSINVLSFRYLKCRKKIIFLLEIRLIPVKLVPSL